MCGSQPQDGEEEQPEDTQDGSSQELLCSGAVQARAQLGGDIGVVYVVSVRHVFQQQIYEAEGYDDGAGNTVGHHNREDTCGPGILQAELELIGLTPLHVETFWHRLGETKACSIYRPTLLAVQIVRLV